MFKRVLVASVFVVVGSIASEARPVLAGHPAECNVTMPCDFSFSQARQTILRGSPPMQRASFPVAGLDVGRGQEAGRLVALVPFVAAGLQYGFSVASSQS